MLGIDFNVWFWLAILFLISCVVAWLFSWWIGALFFVVVAVSVFLAFMIAISRAM